MSDRVSFRSVDVRLGEPPSSSSRGRRRDTPVLNSIAGSLVGIDENNLGEDLPEDDFRFNGKKNIFLILILLIRKYIAV